MVLNGADKDNGLEFSSPILKTVPLNDQLKGASTGHCGTTGQLSTVVNVYEADNEDNNRVVYKDHFQFSNYS